MQPIVATLVFAFPLALQAQKATDSADPATAAEAVRAEVEKETEQEELFAGFEQMLKKSVLVGTFMIDVDKDKKRIDERYEISKVVKQPKGDYWMFYSRIKYGKHDVTLPIPVEVKWAGTTPVITVDNLTIPGMGTFDARVLFADGKYAGTWRHGEVGGLMFGHLEKQPEKSEKVPANQDQKLD